MNERNNKSKKDYRLDPYPKHLIINKIQTQTQTQISSNGIASSSKTVNNNNGNNLMTIQIDFTQNGTSLLDQYDPNQLKQCSKDYFTPRQIFLWVKLLELIVHLSKDLNEKLNNDYISMEWIIHREKIRFRSSNLLNIIMKF